MKYINAFWFVGSNVGDAYTSWIIEKISGKPAVFTPMDCEIDKVIVSGSILNHANESCTVWGAGLARESDEVDPATKILAVRGPLSRKRALDCGAACPSIFGDPGLLLSRYYHPDVSVDYELGIVPHFIDQVHAYPRFVDRPEVRLIDVLQPVERVAREILSCRMIISSSLHGLVFGVAYGRNVRWVQFSDEVLGDGMKFHDFFLSIGTEPQEPLNLRGSNAATSELIAEVPELHTDYDLEPLLACCPFAQ